MAPSWRNLTFFSGQLQTQIYHHSPALEERMREKGLVQSMVWKKRAGRGRPRTSPGKEHARVSFPLLS